MRAIPLVALALLAGCNPAPAPNDHSSLPEVLLVGQSTALPYSNSGSIALIEEDLACMLDSYESQVHCGGPDAEWTMVLGRPGEGPGEFGAPLSVLRGSNGLIGVRDGRPARLTIFSASGDLQKTVPLPFLFTPVGPFTDSVVIGTFPSAAYTRSAPPMLAAVSLMDGALLRVDTLRHPSELGLPSSAEWGLSQGARHHQAGLVFGTGDSEFVRYHLDGTLIDNFQASWTGELPNSRDVEEHREGLTIAFGGAADATVQAFALEPKRYRIRGRSMIYDERGRLWVATQRERDRSSYLDVFHGTEFLGSVQVRDRLLGFDLLDSLLVVLVERSDLGPEGLPVRAVDWYRIRN